MRSMATTSQSAAKTEQSETVVTLLSIRNIAKSFGKNPVLRNVSLEIAEGEFLTILGESGSGKTTLLRIIAGFESADSGSIWMEGQRLDALPPYRRRVNTVFQHYALFPHLTVEENVGYGLRVARLPKEDLATRVEQALAMVKSGAHVDVLVTDIEMPDMDGFALAAALRENPQAAATPIIGLSAMVSADAIERGRAAGFHDFVAKFDRAGLVAAIKEQSSTDTDQAA